MHFFRCLFFVSLAALAACGPAVETTSFTLPASPGGRLCTHQCVEAQDYCHQACTITQRQCVNGVQTQAMNDYDSYTRHQFAKGEQIDLLPSDFEREGPCDSTRQECVDLCDNHYQTCYQTCGGKVTTSSSCQFLCF